MDQSQDRSSWRMAVYFVGTCEAVGFLSGLVGGVYWRNPWIDETPKPALWPPAWGFPVVWAVVNYPSLGIATWLVWRRRPGLASAAMRAFVAQLVYNATFLPLVYRVKKRSFYVVMDAGGVLLTAATARAYARAAPLAGLAIAPYAAWTCFTTLIKVLWWAMEKDRATTSGNGLNRSIRAAEPDRATSALLGAVPAIHLSR